MANLITLIRMIMAIVVVGLLFIDSQPVYIAAVILTAVVIWFDGLDGFVARKFNEVTKFGALLDIMGDRIVENTYWVLFAVMGWLNILFPLIALTRGFITDTIRSAAMEKGLTPFGMQVNPICKWITGSKFMRITYAVAKVAAFVLIVAAKIPGIQHADLLWTVAYWTAVVAIVFCVVRGLPVMIEAKRVIEG